MLHILSYIYNMNLCKHVFIMNIQIYIYIYTVCITYIIVISAFHIYIYLNVYTATFSGAKYQDSLSKISSPCPSWQESWRRGAAAGKFLSFQFRIWSETSLGKSQRIIDDFFILFFLYLREEGSFYGKRPLRKFLPFRVCSLVGRE